MRKYIYIIIINIIFSAPVTENTAKRVAENIIVERFMSTVHGGYTIVSSEMIKDNDQNLIYIFHLNPMGFVLISADDRVSPILAYSYESNFITENMPQNVSYFINTHKYEILDAIENNRIAEQKVIDEWVKYENGGNLNRRSNNVDPLLTAEFGRGEGWNAYCPEDAEGPGGHALVGGFAVALAQIMYYWSWPTQGEGYTGYTSPYGFLEQDFSSASYDYDAMENTIPTDATAQLLSDLGIALETIYGATLSNYDFDDEVLLFSILSKNFYYRNDIEPVAYWDDSFNDWTEYIEKLKTELDNGRPIIYAKYSGWSWTPNIAYNIDGYNEDQFHINWGMGGEDNGYYTLSENTDGNAVALINIKPMDKNEPILRLESYQFIEKTGDIDMIINPGETIKFITSFFIPSIFSNADSIKTTLITEELGIIMTNDNSYYGLLNAGDTLSNISDPFIIEIDSNITFGSKDIILNAISYSDGISYEKQYEFELDVSLWQSGFPQSVQFKKSTPLVIDYDNDGNKEIIVGDTHGKVRVFNKDGSEILNDDFPYDTGGQIWGSPAAADMDGDGLIDFVITSKSKNAYIFDKTGLKAQYSAGYFLLGTPAIGNLDADEDLEFVIASYGGGAGNGNGVWAINPDGSVVNGFPIDITPERVKVGVALADFNSNGRDDIVFGTDDGNLCLYYDDGTMAPGFPFSTDGKIQSAPGILNMNGQKIIFFGSKDNFFYAVNSDGSLRFSIEANGGIFISPAFLFYQERYFVFFGDDGGMIYAVDIAGNSLTGWPVSIGDNDEISTSVVFSDLNGDEEPEVIVISDDGKCFVYDIAGNIAEGLPFNNESSFSSAPVVIDIDSDNDLEIIGASINHLSMYDIKTPGSTLNYWNLYRGNNRRTGYEPGDECATEFDNCGVCGGDGGTCLSVHDLIKTDKFSLTSIYPNPFNPVTKIDFSIPIYELVTIDAYDIKGRAIETLVNKKLQPGTYSINWHASAHPSGIYLIKMNSDNYFHTQKVILIK